MIVFITAAILGVLVFSGAIPIGKKSTDGGALGTVVMWGTVSSSVVAPLLEEFNTANPSYVVKYVQRSPDTLDQDVLEALASGQSPDILFLPDNLIFHYANKIFTIPYTSYPLASFKNAYASAGEVFLSPNGVMALPLYIDPLVMYYNRSMFDANAVVYPPLFWDEFETLVPTLNKRDASNKLIKSAVALGQFSNVNNAKSIIASMFMQAGSPIVSLKNNAFIPALDNTSGYDLNNILSFYTNFADPNSSVYSWNKSFPNSLDAFSKEDVAIYFGFASELSSLVNRNPNQNFLPAPIPQIRNSNTKLTDAHVTGLAVMSASRNSTAAFAVANLLSAGSFASKVATALAVAPARRDLLQAKPTDSYFPIFYNSALYAKSFVDPSPKDTDEVFRSMVENVLSNNSTPSDSLSGADSKLGLLLLR